MREIDEKYFGDYFPEGARVGDLTAAENAIVNSCFEYVTSRFGRMKYILGLAIDFTLLAQQLNQHDDALSGFEADLDQASLFERYELVTERAGRKANTLTLTIDGTSYGIRKLEEHVRNYFYEQQKLGYPSAYVYNTGQWAKYQDLLVDVFRLSRAGRFALLEELLEYGNEQIETQEIAVLPASEVGPFEQVIQDYERTDTNENGGLAYQAISYGFISQQYGHLSILADKVRTGSARQKRSGDVDAYAGNRLAVTFEIKDLDIDPGNVLRELGDFRNKVQSLGVLGIVVCKDCTDETEEELLDFGVRVLRESEMKEIVSLWDVSKQDQCIRSTLHYLANIEHNSSAVRRFLRYVDEID